jgi:hypothetical protein
LWEKYYTLEPNPELKKYSAKWDKAHESYLLRKENLAKAKQNSKPSGLVLRDQPNESWPDIWFSNDNSYVASLLKVVFYLLVACVATKMLTWWLIRAYYYSTQVSTGATATLELGSIDVRYADKAAGLYSHVIIGGKRYDVKVPVTYVSKALTTLMATRAAADGKKGTVKETSVSTSKLRVASKPPKGMAVIHAADPGYPGIGEVYGTIFRLEYGSSSVAVTAAHVMQSLKREQEDGKVIYIHSRGRNTPLPNGFKIVLMSPIKHLDYVGMEFSQAFWSVIGLGMLKMRPNTPTSGCSVSVYSPKRDGTWCKGYGNMTDKLGLLKIKHTASTLQGSSGSPIMTQRGILGIHTAGHTSSTEQYNVASYLYPLLSQNRLETSEPSEMWSEEEPDFDWEYESDFEEMKFMDKSGWRDLRGNEKAFSTPATLDSLGYGPELTMPPIDWAASSSGIAWGDMQDDMLEVACSKSFRSAAQVDAASVSKSTQQTQPSDASTASGGILGVKEQKVTEQSKSDPAQSNSTAGNRGKKKKRRRNKKKQSQDSKTGDPLNKLSKTSTTHSSGKAQEERKASSPVKENSKKSQKESSNNTLEPEVQKALMDLVELMKKSSVKEASSS